MKEPAAVKRGGRCVDLAKWYVTSQCQGRQAHQLLSHCPSVRSWGHVPVVPCGKFSALHPESQLLQGIAWKEICPMLKEEQRLAYSWLYNTRLEMGLEFCWQQTWVTGVGVGTQHKEHNDLKKPGLGDTYAYGVTPGMRKDSTYVFIWLI